MKWTSRSQKDGNLGEGYQSGEFIVKETFHSYELQQKFGGKRCDYFWVLLKNDKVICYGKTAKSLKKYAEEHYA